MNQYVHDRMKAIQGILNSVHQAGASMSTASRGQERSAFIQEFLQAVMPTTYRFGSGDATDGAGHRSGQLDVVVENPFAPCVHLGVGATRLYLAEGVAAVIEVKSDVANQWDEAVQTAQQLAPLSKSYSPWVGSSSQMSTVVMSPSGPVRVTTGGSMDRVPLFVVGYTGWKQMKTIESRLSSTPSMAGVLVIDSGIFVSGPEYGYHRVSGSWSLWHFITCLFQAISAMQNFRYDPLIYAR
jgi:hypothetical protein